MFDLVKQPVLLSNVNPRSELNGTDHRLAADLKLEFNMENADLADFHPRLKSSFYFRDESSAADEKRDLADKAQMADPEYKPNLVFGADLGPLKWKRELVGATVTIHAPVSGKDITLESCQVDKFEFDLKEGGTVAVTCRVITHPSEETLGRMCGMIQSQIEISITPPESE